MGEMYADHLLQCPWPKSHHGVPATAGPDVSCVLTVCVLCACAQAHTLSQAEMQTKYMQDAQAQTKHVNNANGQHQLQRPRIPRTNDLVQASGEDQRT